MMRGLFCNPKAYVIAGVVALLTLAGSPEVFAQGGGSGATEVTFTPIVNFGDLFSTITTTLAPIVAGALGLGLAIWGARYVFGVVKSMGR